MKKILFSFLCAFGSTVLSHAQDLITTKDGSDIQAVILEVTTSEVKYKKYSNLDGPIFTMPKSDILIVRYENGENDVFAASDASLNTPNAIIVGMRYKEYKDYYDPKFYVPQPGDPYSRIGAGIGSFFIPGLGECIDGEWGRGGLIFLGNIVLWDLMFSTSMTILDGNAIPEDGILLFGLLCAQLGLRFWSVFDAVKIAKVKNMYYQDLRSLRTGVDFKVEPYLTCAPTGQTNSLQPAAGLSLRLNF